MTHCKRNSATTYGRLTGFLLSALLAGCGGGGGSGGGGSGTLGVSLTDSPACGFDEVNVTVSKVRVHQSGGASENAGGWSEITLSPARKINLLDLTNGVLESLGETVLPAGRYTQVRLVLVANNGSSASSNSIVLTSGTPAGEIALITPSAVHSGIKLVHEFDVAADQRVDLVLDFDACKSVVVRSTVPVASTGSFFLARLAPGNYDVVLAADSLATAVIGAVPVASRTSVVMVSTNATPISLPASTTRNISGNATLTPASATGEVIFVAAKQTFGSGPTVTVKSQAADLLSGDYTLALPVAAPLLGHYGAGTLPIALEEQSALAGQYTVEASASGYQTQSFSQEISTADATRDFALVP